MCVRLDTYKLLIHSLELTALLLGLYTSLESFTFSDREILRNSLKQDVIVAIDRIVLYLQGLTNFYNSDFYIGSTSMLYLQGLTNFNNSDFYTGSTSMPYVQGLANFYNSDFYIGSKFSWLTYCFEPNFTIVIYQLCWSYPHSKQQLT